MASQTLPRSIVVARLPAHSNRRGGDIVGRVEVFAEKLYSYGRRPVSGKYQIEKRPIFLDLSGRAVSIWCRR
jgi:hypothetical protein